MGAKVSRAGQHVERYAQSQRSSAETSTDTTHQQRAYKQPTDDQPKQHQRYRPYKADIYLLGITIVIGGQYFSWNAGLEAGVFSCLITYLLIGSAYIVFCMCTSEITGALPFAGGSYGLARCTLGFYIAFLVGSCEALQYIVYVSASVISLSEMIVKCLPSLSGCEPVVFMLFYGSALAIHVSGDRVFWAVNAVLGVVSLFLLLLFCVGSLPFVSFSENAVANSSTFVHGVSGFMLALPLACWFFVGVEALNLASDQVEQPKTTVPPAQLACVVTLFITGLMVFFVTVSLPVGAVPIAAELVPFSLGFSPMFHISNSTATILSLPATYATAFGFIWCYGKLICAMAASHLLPPILSKTRSKCGTPYAGIIFGSVISLVICLVVYLVPSINSYIFTTCIMCALLSYTGQCVGYISLKLKYRNIKSSSFKSPFGIAGAVYAMSVWLLTLIAVVGFQGHGCVEVVFFLLIVFILSMVYHAYSKKRQVFSIQENKILLVAHVLKFNSKRKAMRTKVVQSAQTAASSGLLSGKLVSHKSYPAPNSTDARSNYSQSQRAQSIRHMESPKTSQAGSYAGSRVLAVTGDTLDNAPTNTLNGR